MTTVSEIFETMAYGPAPESDKPALEWIARHDGAFGLFIGGRWVQGQRDTGVDVNEPPPTSPLSRGTPTWHAPGSSAAVAGASGAPPRRPAPGPRRAPQ